MSSEAHVTPVARVSGSAAVPSQRGRHRRRPEEAVVPVGPGVKVERDERTIWAQLSYMLDDGQIKNVDHLFPFGGQWGEIPARLADGARLVMLKVYDYPTLGNLLIVNFLKMFPQDDDPNLYIP